MGAGICLFKRLGNGILCTVNGIHERKTIEKWEWDFNLSNRQAGIVGFELGFEKRKHFLGNGISRGGVLIPFSSKLFFSNPTIPACRLLKSKSHSHFSIVFLS